MLTEKQLEVLINIEEDVQLKAAQLSMLCGEYRTNQTRVLRHFEPLTAPLRRIIFAGAQKRQYIETQLIWLERIIFLHERRGSSNRLSPQELRGVEQELMLPVQRAMQDCYQQLSILTKEELAVLRNYECPPEQALETMTMVLRVRGDEDTRWSTVRVVLSESYFFTFFISRSQTLLQQPLADDVFEELERFCVLPEHAPEALASISVPLGALGQWLYAVRDYYRVKRILAPPSKPLTRDEKQQMMTRLRHELQSVKESIQLATEKLKEQQQEIVRKLVDVRNEYDDTMCPLHDSLEKKTAAFIKVLGNKGQTAEGDAEELEEEEDQDVTKE